MTKKLIILDFHNYLYRAYFGVRGLTTPDGRPINAAFGVTKMISTIMSDFKPDYFVIVEEGGGVSKRKEMYAEYKANRSSMPEDLRSQIPILKQIIALLDIPIISIPNIEADDVLASFAVQAPFQTVLIASSDKDLMAVVSDKIQILDTMKNKIYDRKAVIEKFGVAPEQITDYLTLLGDASDNIPGAEGIGAKTAAKLLQDHGNLETILSADIPGKVGMNLKAAKDIIELSKRLVTLELNLPIDFTPKQYNEVKREELNELFKSLGMHSLLNRF
jgi:DNA polymerase-1